MGRFGAWRDGWTAWSRRRRVAVMAAVAAGTALVGAGVGAASDPPTPPPVVWHDYVADPTTTTSSGPDALAAPGPAGDPSTTSPSARQVVESTAPQPPATGPGPGTSRQTTTTRPPAASTTTTTRPNTVVPGGDPLNGLRVAAEGPRAGYQRELFGGWIDADHDRCDTREEVLQAQSTTPPQTDYSGTSCKVMAGDWVSLYDGALLTDRTEVEIDHVVALAEAWDSGAASWDQARRRAFANDLVSPELLAVSSSSNHAKSDRDPAEWAPPRADAHCRFASDWIAIKKAWDLSADPTEVVALRRMLTTCPGAVPTTTTSTTAPPSAGSGGVVISGLDCQGERVTVRNGGSAPADLTGWSISDEGHKHTFAFPTGYHLAPGASVSVRSGGLAGPGELQWKKQPVWNNDGDTATLADAGGSAPSSRSC